MAIQPHDILSDEASYATFGQVTIRKGTIAAAIANAEIIISTDASSAAKEEARQIFIMLARQLQQTPFAKHLTWRHPDIQTIIEECKDD